VDAGATADDILEGVDAELGAFAASVGRYLLY